ncbi:hypothetical protein [Neobacillus cucumis]|uniref:hypothetical protein n=1 Tax=Neobacillus cucumis TaxID=1740721 RepID=UPI0028534196|nr:hypothetical protein [Neobacillus cucumis]MDR4945139.1 hypothetical protein [Neobacillus cucumis]
MIFTSSTILPLDSSGDPLCFPPKWEDNPHSWVKLWKHHAGQEEADDITQIAQERNEAFLSRYGGKISKIPAFKPVKELKEAAK